MAKATICDVLVIGSGASGLTAAITAQSAGLEVIVAEKEALLGGTSAMSGGMLWIPCNGYQGTGVGDSAVSAREYIRANAGNLYDEQRVSMFLAEGPKMLEFLKRETDVRFELPEGNPDYRPALPGALPTGRSLMPLSFDGRRLGAEYCKLRRPARERALFMGMQINGSEMKHFMRATRSIKSFLVVVGRILRHLGDVAFHGQDMTSANGNALVAALLKTTIDRKITIWPSRPARALIFEGGAVKGAILSDRDGGDLRVSARRGVVLACGGFPHDYIRREQVYPHHPKPGQHLSAAPTSNTGDGIRLAEAVGGGVAPGYLNPGSWFPTSLVPYSDGSTGVYAHLIERGKPGVIAVNPAGNRFTDEAQNYHDFVSAMLAMPRKNSEVSAFFVCDHRAFLRYGLGMAKPWPMINRAYLKSGYILRGSTLEELAGRAGIDPKGLNATVARYNRFATEGSDPDFRKGENVYDRGQGDASHRPNPCVGPLDHPPFYAVRLLPGDLGTFSGLRTDHLARVLNNRGEAIQGLYAVGNDQASVFGGSYPGAGATLGPGMTFGYVAGRQLAIGAT